MIALALTLLFVGLAVRSYMKGDRKGAIWYAAFAALNSLFAFRVI